MYKHRDDMFRIEFSKISSYNKAKMLLGQGETIIEVLRPIKR